MPTLSPSERLATVLTDDLNATDSSRGTGCGRQPVPAPQQHRHCPSGTGDGKSMSDLHEGILAISPDIRYVSVAQGQQVQMRSRPDLHDASSSDSDLYEELLANPTLATQRGNIDCGGLRYLIVGYGHERASPIAAEILAGLSPAQAAELTRQVRDRLAAYASPGGVSMPGAARLVTAQAV